MKKFIDVIRRNIFYIALIAGMAALVALVAMYNVKMESKDKNGDDADITSEVADGVEGSGEEDYAAANNTSGTDENSLEKNIEETISDSGKENAEESMSDNKENSTDSTTSEDEGTPNTDTIENGTNSTNNENTSDEVVLDFEGTADIMWPINGNIIIPFSMDTTVYFETLNEYKCNPGLVIEAAEGDKVQSVYKSLITEVGTTPEYGNYVKASLGNGYEVMYAGLADINVSVNQVVEAGVTIGTIAEPTRYFTAEGPNLYFTITKDGVPVDPSSVIE
jgi:septal ring factor EnvC (AmiA/AmiB activator)